jgi:2-polyprenyl-3-methyl-5-hydroxy-6-metoxy-1,4-benzoquinol methylase
MYEKLDLCPICKNAKFSNYLICKDYSVSGESFAIVQCTKCELIFTNPRPDEESMPTYYKSENYISHTNKDSNPIISQIYKYVRSISLANKLKLINKYSTGEKVLDFGSGTGNFVHYLNRHGKDAFGIEPNSNARNIAKAKQKDHFFESLEEINSKFDIITAWHVIEHVSELRGTIKQLRKLLKKEGLLFIAVPNINSYDAKKYQEYWAGLDVPRHLYHFTKDSIKQLAKKTKLKIKEVYPLVYDSYYVSLLSERYQNGKNNYLKAFQSGKTSNKEARKTGEYSSLIYILSK